MTDCRCINHKYNGWLIPCLQKPSISMPFQFETGSCYLLTCLWVKEFCLLCGWPSDGFICYLTFSMTVQQSGKCSLQQYHILVLYTMQRVNKIKIVTLAMLPTQLPSNKQGAKVEMLEIALAVASWINKLQPLNDEHTLFLYSRLVIFYHH